MLLTKIRIKFFTVGNKRSATSLIRAKKGHQFTEDGILDMLGHFANRLEDRLPDEEFSCVKIGPASYNFVHVGKRVHLPVVSNVIHVPHIPGTVTTPLGPEQVDEG